VRKVYQRVLVMLQKPARRVTFEAAGVPMFLSMLAEPYPVDLTEMIHIQDAKSVDTTVSLTLTRRVRIEFSEAIHVLSLDAAGAARLAQQVNDAQIASAQLTP
jgi:hypothetical protein